MPLEPRPEIRGLTGCVHGGPDYSELKSLGLSSEEVLDFSVCCNPYSPPQSMRHALSTLKIDRYPDPSATELRQKLAQTLGVSAETILAGSGTTELIRLIALAFFRAGDEVMILQPTYGEYELAGRIAGAKIVESRWGLQGDRSNQVSDLIKTMGNHHLKAVFICNPNNPTGFYFSRAEIESILKACCDSLLILDEAYVSFVNEAWSSLDLIENGNVVILRSMTKDYALAGLRLGYALAREEIISTLRRVCPPWNVNIAAQKAGLAVLNEPQYLARSQARISRSRQFLLRELAKIGLSTESSQANFFLVKTGGGRQFRAALLKHGILVRDCASFGLPEYIRIAPRTLAECRRFIKAVRQLKQEGALPLTLPKGD